MSWTTSESGAWMFGESVAFTDIPVVLSVAGTSLSDMGLSLGFADGLEIESLSLRLATATIDRGALSLLLSTEDEDMKEHLHLYLGTATGVVLEGMKLFLSSIVAPKALKSSIAQRLETIIEEVA